MKKEKGNWGLASTHGSVQTGQVGAKKIRECWPVVLVCTLVLVLDGASQVVRASTANCGEPDTCIVLVRAIGRVVQCRYDSYLLEDVSGYDWSCEDPKKTRIGAAEICLYPGAYYNVSYYKFYWIGYKWEYTGVVAHYTLGDSSHTPLPPVPGEIVSSQLVWIPTLYPNGCADLPKPISDNTPNPDPGKPDCPQPPLN